MNYIPSAPNAAWTPPLDINDEVGFTIYYRKPLNKRNTLSKKSSKSYSIKTLPIHSEIWMFAKNNRSNKVLFTYKSEDDVDDMEDYGDEIQIPVPIS
jgi:hypothetical protein